MGVGDPGAMGAFPTAPMQPPQATMMQAPWPQQNFPDAMYQQPGFAAPLPQGLPVVTYPMAPLGNSMYGPDLLAQPQPNFASGMMPGVPAQDPLYQ